MVVVSFAAYNIIYLRLEKVSPPPHLKFLFQRIDFWLY